MRRLLQFTTAIGALALSAQIALAGPNIVSGPGADPECFAPWSADTKYMQWEAKPGPYRIAIVNGFDEPPSTWQLGADGSASRVYPTLDRSVVPDLAVTQIEYRSLDGTMVRKRSPARPRRSRFGEVSRS